MDNDTPAKPPFYIHFVANLPGYVSFSKIDYTGHTTTASLSQLERIAQSVQAHLDKVLHDAVDLSAIDEHLKHVPAAHSEKDHHARVDFYNSPKLKELVLAATTKKEWSDYETFQMRERVWIYVARKIFRDALMRTDYSLYHIEEQAAESDQKISDFGRKLY
jgi:hypothetical protein